WFDCRSDRYMEFHSGTADLRSSVPGNDVLHKVQEEEVQDRYLRHESSIPGDHVHHQVEEEVQGGSLLRHRSLRSSIPGGRAHHQAKEEVQGGSLRHCSL